MQVSLEVQLIVDTFTHVPFSIHFVPESATTRSPLVGFGPRTLTNLVACRCSTHWLDDFVLAQDSGSNTIDLLATYYASI